MIYKNCVARLTLFLFLSTTPLAVIADGNVTYFEKPPTPQQLMNALRAQAEEPADDSMAGRGFEWTVDVNQNSPASGKTPAQKPASIANKPIRKASGNGPAVAVPVNFDWGSSQVKANSLPFIEVIAATLSQDPNLKLMVEGHTDATGSSQNNLMLSWERAFSVFQLLVRQYGIDPSRLKPEGKGSSEPMSGSNPSDGLNRRVQFREMN